jgi:hypothetical protein
MTSKMLTIHDSKCLWYHQRPRHPFVLPDTLCYLAEKVDLGRQSVFLFRSRLIIDPSNHSG